MSSQDIPTKEKILKIAMDVFLSEGFDAVSSQRVADESGVTKAMIYYYFSSKTDLVTAVIITLMEQIRSRVAGILAESESLYVRMLKVATARLKVDTKIDMSILLHEERRSFTDEQIDQIHASEKRLMDTIADAFEQSAAEGEIKPIDGAFAARIFSALLNAGRSQEFVHIPAQERAQKLVDMLWTGIENA